MSHNAVINAGNPSLEVLDWVIWLICREIKLPRSRSIFFTNPYISRALSTFKSEVCEVGARLKLERTLHVWTSVVKSFYNNF